MYMKCIYIVYQIVYWDQVSSNIKKSLGASHLITEIDIDVKRDACHFRELVHTLREKFHRNETNKADKLHILTLLPPDWSAEMISRTMGTTIYMAKLRKNSSREKEYCLCPMQNTVLIILWS